MLHSSVTLIAYFDFHIFNYIYIYINIYFQ